MSAGPTRVIKSLGGGRIPLMAGSDQKNAPAQIKISIDDTDEAEPNVPKLYLPPILDSETKSLSVRRPRLGSTYSVRCSHSRMRVLLLTNNNLLTNGEAQEDRSSLT